MSYLFTPTKRRTGHRRGFASQGPFTTQSSMNLLSLPHSLLRPYIHPYQHTLARQLLRFCGLEALDKRLRYLQPEFGIQNTFARMNENLPVTNYYSGFQLDCIYRFTRSAVAGLTSGTPDRAPSICCLMAQCRLLRLTVVRSINQCDAFQLVRFLLCFSGRVHRVFGRRHTR